MDSAESIEEPYAVSGPSHITLCCPACGTYQRVEVEYDDGQGYASLALTSCSHCHQDLCPCCPQPQCECGEIVCSDCAVIVPDGTLSPLTLCPACAALEEDEIAPATDTGEIEAAQRLPTARRQPGGTTQHARDGMRPVA